MSRELCYLTAVQMAQAFANGTLSPVEVCGAILERIDRLNPQVNAFFHVDTEGAMRAARRSEQRWTKGAAKSPLDGVPVSFKDHIPTIGMPSVWGVKAIDERGPWSLDASPVTRLKDAGAVVLGKTTMCELGLLTSGASSRYGTSRTPWDLAKTAGGSSGGAASAVCAGMGPIAIGTDGGGSIRLPASFNGVFGFKPCGGRVPMYPMFGLNPVVGPLTRSVDDAALVMNVISQPDPRDFFALPATPHDFTAGLRDGIEGVRIGVVRSMGFGDVAASEILTVLEAGARTLAAAGATLVDIPPPFDFDLPGAAFPAVWPLYVPRFQQLCGGRLDQLLPELQRLVASTSEVTLEEFVRADGYTHMAIEKFASLFWDVDLLLTPSTTCTAFSADDVFPAWANLDRFGYYFGHAAFLFMANDCALPACSLFAGLDTSGLPVGLQLIGSRYADDLVLRAAHTYEQARPAVPAYPDPSYRQGEIEDVRN